MAGYGFADLRRLLLRLLRGQAEVIRHPQRQIQVNGVVVLAYIEGEPVSSRVRIHIVERGQPPAGGGQEKTVVAQVVISIGHRHAEHNPLPQLGQILPGRSPMGPDERRQIQIAASVRRRGPIGLAQQGHGGSEVDAAAALPVEALD